VIRRVAILAACLLRAGDGQAAAQFFLGARTERFEPTRAPPYSQWQWPDPESGPVSAADGHLYRRKYSIDFAAGEFACVPRVATGQAFTLMASDLLGDHLFFASVTTYQGQQVRNLFENISLQGLYINQTHRLGWGGGAFRVTVGAGPDVSRASWTATLAS